jgi:hypothetical protein
MAANHWFVRVLNKDSDTLIHECYNAQVFSISKETAWKGVKVALQHAQVLGPVSEAAELYLKRLDSSGLVQESWLIKVGRVFDFQAEGKEDLTFSVEGSFRRLPV